MEDPPRVAQDGDDPQRMDERLDTLVPDEPNKPYDIKDAIRMVVDKGEFFEIHEHYAPTLSWAWRAGWAHRGHCGNQPAVLAGVLDINSSRKGARFVRFCDCFNIPSSRRRRARFFARVDQEHGGIILHGAKLLYAFCERRAQADRHHSQGLWRRVRRDEQQAHPRRL